MFYVGGEYDLCFGAAELLEFVDEVVQFHGGTEGYFDEHGVIAGDAVAFDDVGNCLNEWVEVFFLVGLYFKIDEGFYMITKKDRVDLGVIACDQPGFFKMLDSGGDGGGREENFLCDLLYRGAGVFLQHFDDLPVDVVKLVVHVQDSFLWYSEICVSVPVSLWNRCISILSILHILSQHKKRLYKNKRNTINSLKN